MTDVEKLKQYNTVLDLISQIRYTMLHDWHQANIIHHLDVLDALVYRETKKLEADIESTKW